MVNIMIQFPFSRITNIIFYNFLYRSVTNNTLHFFGLAEDEEEELTRQKWNYRRMRHLSRIGIALRIKQSNIRNLDLYINLCCSSQ